MVARDREMMAACGHVEGPAQRASRVWFGPAPYHPLKELGIVGLVVLWLEDAGQIDRKDVVADDQGFRPSLWTRWIVGHALKGSLFVAFTGLLLELGLIERLSQSD